MYVHFGQPPQIFFYSREINLICFLILHNNKSFSCLIAIPVLYEKSELKMNPVEKSNICQHDNIQKSFLAETSSSTFDNINLEEEENEKDDEEFLILLKFDNDSYPFRNNINHLKFLGIHDNQLIIKIGDAYFLGKRDPIILSSLLFTLDSKKVIQETHKCHSRLLMQRIILKPKNEVNQ